MPRHTPPPDIEDHEEVECCSTCEQPEDDCCCSYCDGSTGGCDERFEDGNGCRYGYCDHCENCCECEECPSCSNVIYSNGEYHDDYCHDCGECHGCCCCEEEDCEGNRAYSTDPMSVFHFKAKTDDFDPIRWRRCKPIKALHMQRFGIEIEKSQHSQSDDITMNDITDRLSMWGLLDSHVSGYSVACNDASLTGPNPAESKTCPLTFRDHQLCHYAYMMLGQGWSRDYWREHLEYYHSLSSFRQFNMFRRYYYDGGMDFRWQKGAKAWSNSSCGMHVNVSNTMSTEMTLYKVFLYIVRSHPNDMKFIGGRSTNEHYCRTHKDKQVWCQDTDRYLDVCHLNYVHQVGVGSNKHEYASCNKHDAMSRRAWHGWEMRLFRSSTNPMRILGNMQMAQLLCDYFQYVPFSNIEGTGLGPIVRHSVFNRRTFPYAAGNFARQAELVHMVDTFKSHMRDVRRNTKKGK